MKRKFTVKQRTFIEEYLVDLNATQAAIRAGYSRKTAKEIGCENLSKPNIQEAIRVAMDERSQRTGVTVDRVLAAIAKIGFSDIREIFTVSGKLCPITDLPDDIEIVCNYNKHLPPVNCSLLLLDIFLELITNACKAMENQKLRRLEISSRSEQMDGLPWVMVKISDTGKGMPAHHLEHLWNLFQPSDEGLGFGLWWMRTFIERQGGTIECQSQLSEGSTFSVRLPVDIGTPASVEEELGR